MTIGFARVSQEGAEGKWYLPSFPKAPVLNTPAERLAIFDTAVWGKDWPEIICTSCKMFGKEAVFEKDPPAGLTTIDISTQHDQKIITDFANTKFNNEEQDRVIKNIINRWEAATIALGRGEGAINKHRWLTIGSKTVYSIVALSSLVFGITSFIPSLNASKNWFNFGAVVCPIVGGILIKISSSAAETSEAIINSVIGNPLLNRFVTITHKKILGFF